MNREQMCAHLTLHGWAPVASRNCMGWQHDDHDFAVMIGPAGVPVQMEKRYVTREDRYCGSNRSIWMLYSRITKDYQ